MTHPVTPPDGEPTPLPTSAEDTRAAIARSTHRIEDGVDDLRVGVAATQATQREHGAALARIEAAQAQPSRVVAVLSEPLGWPPRLAHVLVVAAVLVGAVWALGGAQVERLLGLLPGVGVAP